MRIILTGAQGTGKSTVLHELEGRLKDYKIITEVVRNLNKKGVKINEAGDESGQRTIFDTYKEVLSAGGNYISDRGLSDVAAYTEYLYRYKMAVGKEEFVREMNTMIRFAKENKDVLFVFFPIEFPVVKDGVRSEDEGFRHTIDLYIRENLVRHDVEYITVHGTVEERVKTILDAIKLREVANG